LAELLNDIRAFKDEVYAKRPSLVRSDALLISERGEPLTYGMPCNRFGDPRAVASVDKAPFQFRDPHALTTADANEAAAKTRTAQAILSQLWRDFLVGRVGLEPTTKGL
jgi:hypothetical protein